MGNEMGRMVWKRVQVPALRNVELEDRAVGEGRETRREGGGLRLRSRREQGEDQERR